MAAGESSASGADRFLGWFASAGRARALVAGRRTAEEEEMYSVRRRKETGSSPALARARAARGLRRSLSSGWSAGGSLGAWIAAGC